MQNEARRIEEKDIDPIELINLGDITKEQKEEQLDESCEIVDINLNFCENCGQEKASNSACEYCLPLKQAAGEKLET